MKTVLAAYLSFAEGRAKGNSVEIVKTVRKIEIGVEPQAEAWGE